MDNQLLPSAQSVKTAHRASSVESEVDAPPAASPTPKAQLPSQGWVAQDMRRGDKVAIGLSRMLRNFGIAHKDEPRHRLSGQLQNQTFYDYIVHLQPPAPNAAAAFHIIQQMLKDPGIATDIETNCRCHWFTHELYDGVQRAITPVRLPETFRPQIQITYQGKSGQRLYTARFEIKHVHNTRDLNRYINWQGPANFDMVPIVTARCMYYRRPR